jgi:hypothetical protein
MRWRQVCCWLVRVMLCVMLVSRSSTATAGRGEWLGLAALALVTLVFAIWHYRAPGRPQAGKGGRLPSTIRSAWPRP